MRDPAGRAVVVGLRLYVLADDYLLTGINTGDQFSPSVDAVREEMRQEREHNSSWVVEQP